MAKGQLASRIPMASASPRSANQSVTILVRTMFSMALPAPLVSLALDDIPGVGKRMARFDHLDPLAWRAVAITGDHQAFKLTLPMILDRLGHRSAGFASADDNRAAQRPGRQVRRQALVR